MSRRRLAPLAAVLLLPAALLARADYSPPGERSLTSLQERRLVQAFFHLQQGRLNEALDNVAFLVRDQPDFRLAQLVYGDLLTAHANGLRRFGSGLGSETVDGHRAAAEARLSRYLASPPSAAVSANVLKLPSATRTAVAIDLTTYRLYLLENRGGRPVRKNDFYVSIGKGGADKRFEGDEKTPVGVYQISDYLPGSGLPDMYGAGALPMDYPNAWDRLLGRTGSGIWIHGTESDRYSRPPLSSRGCITLSNEDFRHILGRVEVARSPVVVADRLEWVDERSAVALVADIEGAFESWRRDWESRDPELYLRHYSRDFRTPGMSRARFADHKRRVARGKRFIRVGVEDLAIYRYPGEEGVVLLDFRQRYESDSFRSVRRKNQYWRREGGTWRILFEQSV